MINYNNKDKYMYSDVPIYMHASEVEQEPLKDKKVTCIEDMFV